jgi:ketosteroid isomerase-like protein
MARLPYAPTYRTGSTVSTNFKNEPVELLEAGKDQVVAVHRVSGTAKQSGIETEMTYAAVYTIRDRRVVRAREYLARDQALEAAGLSE